MAEVCQGNVYLTVEEDEIDKYLAKGFSLVDERTGKILKQSVPTEIGPLKKLYTEQLELNKQLTSEIAVLRNKLESLEQKAEPAEPSVDSASEDSSSWDDWAEEATPKKKKSTRRAKQ